MDGFYQCCYEKIGENFCKNKAFQPHTYCSFHAEETILKKIECSFKDFGKKCGRYATQNGVYCNIHIYFDAYKPAVKWNDDTSKKKGPCSVTVEEESEDENPPQKENKSETEDENPSSQQNEKDGIYLPCKICGRTDFAMFGEEGYICVYCKKDVKRERKMCCANVKNGGKCNNRALADGNMCKLHFKIEKNKKEKPEEKKDENSKPDEKPEGENSTKKEKCASFTSTGNPCKRNSTINSKYCNGHSFIHYSRKCKYNFGGECKYFAENETDYCRIHKNKICDNPGGCLNFQYMNGKCYDHYYNNGGDVPKCNFPGCNSNASMFGQCPIHLFSFTSSSTKPCICVGCDKQIPQDQTYCTNHKYKCSFSGCTNRLSFSCGWCFQHTQKPVYTCPKCSTNVNAPGFYCTIHIPINITFSDSRYTEFFKFCPLKEKDSITTALKTYGFFDSYTGKDRAEYFVIITIDKSKIQKLYRDQSKKNHPDKGGDPEIFKKFLNDKEVLETLMSKFN